MGRAVSLEERMTLTQFQHHLLQRRIVRIGADAEAEFAPAPASARSPPEPAIDALRALPPAVIDDELHQRQAEPPALLVERTTKIAYSAFSLSGSAWRRTAPSISPLSESSATSTMERA